MPASTGTLEWADVEDRRQRLATTLQAVLESSHLPQSSPELAALTSLAGSWSRPDAQPSAQSSAQSSAQPSALADLAAQAESATAAVSSLLVSQPLLSARRVNVALERIQSAKSVSEVLRMAPSELGWAGDFDRVLLSRVEDSSWVPVAWYASRPDRDDNQAMADLLRNSRIPLGSGMVEAEVLRRKTPAIVRDTGAGRRAFAPFADVAECRAYVVAPVMTGDLVVGLIHADTDPSGRPIADCDVTVVRAFADGLGLILERLALTDKLQSQKEHIRAALVAAEAAVDDLCSAPVTLSLPVRATVAATAEAPAPARIEDRFTAREREVFALLVGGATNAQIADRLTVSETTVKSHVKHILRKMRATNRSQAIAQYLSSSTGERR